MQEQGRGSRTSTFLSDGTDIAFIDTKPQSET
jgi:hypothetical protein